MIILAENERMLFECGKYIVEMFDCGPYMRLNDEECINSGMVVIDASTLAGGDGKIQVKVWGEYIELCKLIALAGKKVKLSIKEKESLW